MDHPNEPHLFLHIAIGVTFVVLLIVWNVQDIMQIHDFSGFLKWLIRP